MIEVGCFGWEGSEINGIEIHRILLTADIRQAILQGVRYDVSQQYPQLKTLKIEVTLEKATAYAPGKDELSMHVVRQFAESETSQEASSGTGRTLTYSERGGYTDLAYSKDYGLSRLSEFGWLELSRSTQNAGPVVLVGIGDSENDRGIFETVRRESSTRDCPYALYYVGTSPVPSSLSTLNDPHLHALPGGPDRTAELFEKLVGQSKLPGISLPVPPPNARIVADMTGSCLEQFPARFPGAAVIAEAIDRGTQFVLSTGDDLQVAREHFNIRDTHLPYWFVTSGGGRISEICRGKLSELWKCEPLSAETRVQLLNELERIIGGILNG